MSNGCLNVAVHAQSSRVKAGKRYLQTLIAMGIAGMEWRFLSTPQRQRFFAALSRLRRYDAARRRCAVGRAARATQD